ncbi:MAG: flagellar basal body P-ring formation chaperone FlgA [Rhodospirillales bacterium]
MRRTSSLRLRQSAIVLAVGLMLALTGSGKAADAPPPVTLRGAVTVAGPALSLGDIFANAGDKADIRIGDAPAAGTPLTLDAQTLTRLARAHNLDWQPGSMQVKAVVERDSVPVSSEDIEARVLMALTEKGIDTEGMGVELGTGPRQLYRPRTAQLALEAISVDPQGRRFSGVLAISAPGLARQTVPVSGRLLRAVKVPVLNRALRPGDNIEERDVDWQEIPDRQVPANAVRDAGGLVGLSARRALAAGQPVLISDLKASKRIGKGQPVTLILDVPGMQLTARGVAMQDGGEGEVIRIVNERSHSVIQGTVTAAGTVLVAAGSR